MGLQLWRVLLTDSAPVGIIAEGRASDGVGVCSVAFPLDTALSLQSACTRRAPGPTSCRLLVAAVHQAFRCGERHFPPPRRGLSGRLYLVFFYVLCFWGQKKKKKKKKS